MRFFFLGKGQSKLDFPRQGSRLDRVIKAVLYSLNDCRSRSYLLLVVLLNVLSEKLSVAGLTVNLAVAKFVLWQLFCESFVSRNGNPNCFVKVIAAPGIFNEFGVK
jgi:hypothetical protein